jgi:pimeloyl-ACP methyl ester carboxylesterase
VINNEGSVEISGLKLEYKRFGNGPEFVVCFHGYGRDANDFLPLQEKLGSQYSVMAFNLFYHGESEFPSSRLHKHPVLPQEFSELITRALDEQKILNFHLIGYSMGGRVSMVLLQNIPDRIKSISLVAPDGIRPNGWYRFASQTLVGQRLNRYSIRNPWVFQWFYEFSNHLGLASKRQANFAKRQMETADKRSLVYKIWMSHRKLTPQLDDFRVKVKDHKIPTYAFVGMYDKVIPATPVEHFLNTLKPHGKLFMLNSGHRIDLGELANDYLSELLG